MVNRSKLNRKNKKTDYFAHGSAYVDKGAVIGAGTQIWHFSHVMPDIKIGRNCRIGQNVYIASGVTIGDNVKIQNNVSVYAGVTLENNVFCGPSMVFTNIINPRCAYPRNNPKHFLKTLVKEGASIGANATIVCGHTIGRYSFIGAGSVVTRDLPQHALAYGNPARVKGWMCECGRKILLRKTKAICPDCGKMYRKRGMLLMRTLNK